jgi:Permuted papain-like amidase enzyme, YaeF/YiiX, C92 family
MWSLLMICVLASGPEAAVEVRSGSPEVLAELKQSLKTGSLLFSQGDCLAVKIFSASSYTHVGGVVVKGGEVTVYDSMNGAGVRKTSLDEYLRLQTPTQLHVVHPATPLSGERAAAYETHLNGQLGRKYAINHHLTGQRCDGLHCAEYMTDALMSAELIRAQNPPRVSPGSLLEGLEKANLYTDGGHFKLKAIEPQKPTNLTWCQSLWYDTGTCCSNTATQLRRWVLCR